MPWDAFCSKHFEEAWKMIHEEYPEYDIGWCDAFQEKDFDEDEKEEYEKYKCGYPDCDEKPWREIVWFEKKEDNGVEDFVEFGDDGTVKAKRESKTS